MFSTASTATCVTVASTIQNGIVDDDPVAILSRELSKLSVQEQEQILLDLHGLNGSFLDASGSGDNSAEDSLQSFASSSPSSSLKEEQDASSHLIRLRNELDHRSQSGDLSKAYLAAKQRNTDHVHNTDLLRLFLRVHMDNDGYHHDRAAQMILQHYDIKQRLFGTDKLTRDICQSDLSPEDLDMLMRGMIQALPQRDESGRDVLLSIFVPQKDAAQTLSFYRSAFYFLMSYLRRQQHLRDIIWICCSVGNFEQETELLENLHANICKGIPQRVVGGHFCGSHRDMERIGAQYQLRLNRSPELKTFHGQEFRKRYHIGDSWHDICSSLAEYGIYVDPSTNFPMRIGGTWSTTNHLALLRELKILEEQASGRAAADYGAHPTALHPFDVLLGKSKRSLNHSGNRRLEVLCGFHYDAYDKAVSKHRKTEVSDRIVSMIHESGGQFLIWKQDEKPYESSVGEAGVWVSADSLQARNKVAHVFRHLRAKKRVQVEALK